MLSELTVPVILWSSQCGRKDSKVNEQLKFTLISAVGSMDRVWWATYLDESEVRRTFQGR